MRLYLYIIHKTFIFDTYTYILYFILYWCVHVHNIYYMLYTAYIKYCDNTNKYSSTVEQLKLHGKQIFEQSSFSSIYACKFSPYTYIYFNAYTL